MTLSAAARIRPYRTSDRDALFDICTLTADAGKGAVGMLPDDSLWGLLFAVPYVERQPDLCWVVESADGRTVGYLVATDDTEAFEQWFHDEWWPRQRAHFPDTEGRNAKEAELLTYGNDRRAGREEHSGEYPAHLHINLLPQMQGQGLGRQLLDTLFAELRERGVPALHLGINPANTAAGLFYERVGMTRIGADEGVIHYGIRFDG